MRLRSGNVKLLQHSAVKTQGLTGKIRVGNNATIQTCRSYRFFFVWLIKNKIKKQELARNSKRCGRHHVTNACMQCYRVLAGKRAAYFRVFELPKSIRTFGRWLCGKYKITRLFKLAYWLLIYYFVVQHIFVPHLRDTSRIHIHVSSPRTVSSHFTGYPGGEEVENSVPRNGNGGREWTRWTRCRIGYRVRAGRAIVVWSVSFHNTYE